MASLDPPSPIQQEETDSIKKRCLVTMYSNLKSVMPTAGESKKQLLLDLLGRREHSAEVRRGVDAAAEHNLGAAALGDLVELGRHFRLPQALAGQVGVVNTSPRALTQ